MNAVRQEAAMGSVYGQRELNTRPGGRKNNGGVRPGAGRPPFTPTKEQRRMVSVLAGMRRPHKEIATLVINPRTGKPIDDVTLRLRFPEELCQAKAKVSLILGTSLLGKAKAGDNGALGMLARGAGIGREAQCLFRCQKRKAMLRTRTAKPRSSSRWYGPGSGRERRFHRMIWSSSR